MVLIILRVGGLSQKERREKREKPIRKELPGPRRGRKNQFSGVWL